MARRKTAKRQLIKRVVVFEDDLSDQKRIRELAEGEGCEVLLIDHSRVADFSENVIEFSPQVAIVDIEFPQSQIAGRHILRFLKKETNIPIVVWSKQMDLPESAKSLFERCEAIGGVEGLIGKQEVLTWQRILDAVEGYKPIEKN